MIDVAYIKIKGGNGGDGAVSFRHERYITKGGPDGGDGGKGGDVYFVADNNLATLKDFKSKEIFKAEDGEPGGRKKMSGADGADVFIKVPLGTLIYEVKEGREIVVCDLSDVGQKYLVAKGGTGGRGNHRFKSPVNQTPLQYTEGIKGEEKRIKLEIRLVADVGLIGMPNAGKSTLINRLTNANAKVASYPFTTLTPNLGMCRLKSGKTIVLSDIPGLIEGASAGKGLGDEFLRHVQRTRVLIHMVDVSDSLELGAKELAGEAVKKYDIIRSELKDYDESLVKKNEMVVVNKVDITEVKESLPEIMREFKKKKIKVFGISAVTGEGIDELISEVEKVLDVTPKVVFETAKATKVYNIDNLPNRKIVFKERRVIEMVRPKH
jgi:GTP-binding protein